jgi:hypothetical protein
MGPKTPMPGSTRQGTDQECVPEASNKLISAGYNSDFSPVFSLPQTDFLLCEEGFFRALKGGRVSRQRHPTVGPRHKLEDRMIDSVREDSAQVFHTPPSRLPLPARPCCIITGAFTAQYPAPVRSDLPLHVPQHFVQLTKPYVQADPHRFPSFFVRHSREWSMPAFSSSRAFCRFQQVMLDFRPRGCPELANLCRKGMW